MHHFMVQFVRQRPGRLAPSPVRDENPAAAGLTPMRLGAFEPVRQRGAGACGTVDCCHERESQPRTWKAPTDGTSRHRDQGTTHSQLTTGYVAAGPGERPGPFSHALSRIRRPRDSQASLASKRYPSDIPAPAFDEGDSERSAAANTTDGPVLSLRRPQWRPITRAVAPPVLQE